MSSKLLEQLMNQESIRNKKELEALAAKSAAEELEPWAPYA